MRVVDQKPSLRQRKKDRTRALLIEVSRKLFLKNGYEATTLEQIAEEAELSVPTLLVYFESKESLALALEYDHLAELKRILENPSRPEDTLHIWRSRVLDGAERARKNSGDTINRLRFLDSSPALVRGALMVLHQMEDVLAEALGKDYSVDPKSDLTTVVLATTLIWGSHAATMHWMKSGGKGDLKKRQLQVVDFVIDRFPKPGDRFVRGRR